MERRNIIVQKQIKAEVFENFKKLKEFETCLKELNNALPYLNGGEGETSYYWRRKDQLLNKIEKYKRLLLGHAYKPEIIVDWDQYIIFE